MDDKNLNNDLSRLDKFPEPEIPADEAWAAMQQLMQQAGTSQEPQKVKAKWPGKSFFYIAVGAVLLAAIGYFVLKNKHTNSNTPTTIINTAGIVQQDTLPGNVFCVADAHTRLQQYPDGAYQIEKGGLFFPVTNEDKALRLQQGPLLVEAHHGGFFIQHDSITGITAIHTQAGTATVSVSPGVPIELHPNESIVFDERKNQLGEKQKANPNLFSYATLIFDFNDTPLKDAAAMLEKAYGVTIEFTNEKLKNCRITTRLDNKNLHDALSIIGYTLNFEYSINQQFKKITILGQGCE